MQNTKVFGVKRLILPLLLVVFLLVSAPSVLGVACCIDANDGDTGEGVKIANDASECAAYGESYKFVADCGETQPVGCCCNGVSAVDFNTDPQQTIYKLYCEHPDNGYTAKDLGTFSSCSNACAGVETTPTTHAVSFTFNAAEYGFAVTDVSITMTNDATAEESVIGTSDAYGVFSTTIEPGVYDFEFTHNSAVIFTNASGVTNAYTCSLETLEDVAVNADVSEAITLTCVATGSGCVPNWDIGEWGDCVLYGGVYASFRRVTDLNGCGVSLGKPPEVDTAQCEDITVDEGDPETLCGNGVLNAGEQCDYDITGQGNHIFDGDAPACNDILLNGPFDGAVSCLPNCLFDTSSCALSCGATCLSVDQCGVCPSCDSAPFCTIIPDAEELTPEFLPDYTGQEEILDYYADTEDVNVDVIYVEGDRDTQINWEYAASTRYILSFTVKTCESSDGSAHTCNPTTLRTQSVDVTDRTVVVDDVFEKENTLYCFNVCSEGTDGTSYCAYEDDDLPCFFSGDTYCMEPHVKGDRCLYDPVTNWQHVYGCTTNTDGLTDNKLSGAVGDEFCNPPDPTDPSVTPQVCAQNFDASTGRFSAQCVAQVLCSECNGAFGLYSHLNLNTKQGANTISCNDLIFSGSPNQFTGICYLEKSNTTVVDYFTQCRQTSCYDYKSKGACEADACYRFTNEDGFNGCEWASAPGYGDELGVGVCRPKAPAEQECGQCDTKSPLGFCSQEICGLYGDCYYKQTNNHGPSAIRETNFLPTLERNSDVDVLQPTCLHESDISCFVYDTQVDCEGEDYDGSIPVIDVEYSGPDGAQVRVGGTHEIINPSQDVYGFGVCKWNDDIDDPEGYGCSKNADARYVFSETNVKRTDDCFDGGAIIPSVDCLRDNQPPVTTLSLKDAPGDQLYPKYGVPQLKNLFFSVQDDVSALEHINTYVSFTQHPVNDEGIEEQPTDYVYPSLSLDGLRKVTSDHLTQNDLSDGTITVSYYSVDEAQNLEVIQRQIIELDATGPSLVDIIFDDISTEVTQDNYLTNLSVEFTLDNDANCYTTLHQLDVFGTEKAFPSGNIASYGSFFDNVVYDNLPDGDYIFRLNCFDAYGNNFEGENGLEFELWIEGDISIANPLPRLLVTRLDDIQDGQLSLETQLDATCRFDTQQVSYETEGQWEFNTDDGKLHTFPIQQLIDEAIIDRIDPSRTYVFFPSCKFTESGKVTEKVSSDIISFTIDELYPSGTVEWYNPESSSYELHVDNPLDWRSNKTIRIFCDDTDSQLPFVSFGCDVVTYCLGEHTDSNEMNCFANYPEQKSYEQLTVVQNLISEAHELPYTIYNRPTLYYYLSDHGGNTGPVQKVKLGIRDVLFDRPAFTEIVPEFVSDYSVIVDTTLLTVPENGATEEDPDSSAAPFALFTVEPAACKVATWERANINLIASVQADGTFVHTGTLDVSQNPAVTYTCAFSESFSVENGATYIITS